MPNPIAFLALILWPLVCVLLFRRLPLERAIVWSILGGYLLLPEGTEFDLPLVPPLDKDSIPSISAFAICIGLAGARVALLPVSRTGKVLTVLFVFSVAATVVGNLDPLVFRVLAEAEPILFETWHLPGLNLRDIFSVVAQQIIVLMPFLLGRQFLASESGLREVLLALVLGGLVYTIPALIEIRLSPQLHTWIYGFFQHDFAQAMRAGGFRPLVFLRHPLWLAFFLFMAVIAAAGMARASSGQWRTRFVVATLWLAGVLVLCKTLAALIYALVFTPLVLFVGVRIQIRIAMLVAVVAIAYPTLRNLEIIPTRALLEIAASIDPEREESLAYRFNNEEKLLDRADAKPLFGWGGWGRNLVRHPETGQIQTIPDGRWIIVFGTFGWVGYIAEMGLLALPLLLLALRTRQMRAREISPYVAPVAIILAANMADMLLNATLVPLTWLCAGAILGHAENLHRTAQEERAIRRATTAPVIGRRSPPTDQRPTVL
jgi:hypothetical protein